MTLLSRFHRPAVASGIAVATLLATLGGATPAFAATALTSVQVTDGTTPPGDEATFASGTPVNLVLNGAVTGEFSFAGGCWLVEADGVRLEGPATAADTTWTAGTAVDTVFPTIDLTPAATTSYDIYVWTEESAGSACAYDGAVDPRISWITMEIQVAPDPESMTLTGSARIGSTVTATAKVPGSLVGDDFDLWVCPDKTIRPTDDAPEGANGDCVGPFIQFRTGDSTSFYLGYDPVRDVNNIDAQDFWDAACGKYFVVHDYPGGGHSNWIGPVDCTVDAAELATTGASDAAGVASVAALIAMLIGGALLISRRRATPAR